MNKVLGGRELSVVVLQGQSSLAYDDEETSFTHVLLRTPANVMLRRTDVCSSPDVRRRQRCSAVRSECACVGDGDGKYE